MSEILIVLINNAGLVALLKQVPMSTRPTRTASRPFTMPCGFRSPVAVETLIEHGANVNQRCRRSGSTPLHRGHTNRRPGTAGKPAAAREIIDILLSAGADPAITNKSGRTPLDYVTDDTVKKLFEHVSK